MKVASTTAETTEEDGPLRTTGRKLEGYQSPGELSDEGVVLVHFGNTTRGAAVKTLY
jgi:hypothetical protein